MAYFNASNGCIKCTTVGYRSGITQATIFPNINAPKRTDEDFRAYKYKEHQQNTTPLVDLPIDMIEDFVVGDELHLLEQGITKQLLTGWKTGYLGKKIIF